MTEGRPLNTIGRSPLEWDPLTMRFDPIRFFLVLEEQARDLSGSADELRSDDPVRARFLANRARLLRVIAHAVRASITEGHVPPAGGRE